MILHDVVDRCATFLVRLYVVWFLLTMYSFRNATNSVQMAIALFVGPAIIIAVTLSVPTAMAPELSLSVYFTVGHAGLYIFTHLSILLVATPLKIANEIVKKYLVSAAPYSIMAVLVVAVDICIVLMILFEYRSYLVQMVRNARQVLGPRQVVPAPDQAQVDAQQANAQVQVQVNAQHANAQVQHANAPVQVNAQVQQANAQVQQANAPVQLNAAMQQAIAAAQHANAIAFHWQMPPAQSG